MAKTPDSQSHILVIDDDPYFLKTLFPPLSEIGEVSTESNPKEGLKRAKTQPLPDVILLDVMMPGLSGYQLCRELKQDPVTFNIPVIFVSSLDQVSEKIRCFDLGGVDFVEKPVEIPVLIARIKNHMMLKLQRDMLEDLAAKDALTGLANKRSYLETIDCEWKRCARANDSLALIICDIDFFKNYNDTLGHGAGDECLREIARVVFGSVTRPGDVVARVGGEEFAIILPHCALEGAMLVASRIIDNVNKRRIAHPNSDVANHVTLSVGVTAVVPASDNSVAFIYEKADEALYKAKESGRNCVVHTESTVAV